MLSAADFAVGACRRALPNGIGDITARIALLPRANLSRLDLDRIGWKELADQGSFGGALKLPAIRLRAALPPTVIFCGV